MDEGSESYMNFQSERGADKSGGERVVEPISLLERRMYAMKPMQCTPERSMWYTLCGAIYVVQCVRFNLCTAVCAVQSM